MTRDIFLAGGCFWGTEHYFKQIEGVVNTEVGFANGHTADPTYKEVYTDTTGYAETVRIEYDDAVVDLEFLLQMFFCAIDPTSLNKQGHDEGTRYRTGVYYTSEDDLPVIEKVFAEEQKKLDAPPMSRTKTTSTRILLVTATCLWSCSSLRETQKRNHKFVYSFA